MAKEGVGDCSMDLMRVGLQVCRCRPPCRNHGVIVGQGQPPDVGGVPRGIASRGYVAGEAPWITERSVPVTREA